MTDVAPSPTPPASLPELSGKMADELAQLESELNEVELLVEQARTEAARHETRRVAAVEKLSTATAAAASAGGSLEPTVAADLNTQLVLMTKRAALMESQVDVLEGKQRALTRFRDSLNAYAAALNELPADAVVSGVAGPTTKGGRKGASAAAAAADPIGSLPPAVSRLLLGAQEDMRREIARAMHDGPAQSLTNIVLQAQIVERLVAKDPARASTEVSQLVAMVQQTLDATKTFIFDVRPMVLDDLGLVPTLRRAARERMECRCRSRPRRREMQVGQEEGGFQSGWMRADWMTTSCVGTFSWPARLAVGTCSILSTTSAPSTTLPNTV